MSQSRFPNHPSGFTSWICLLVACLCCPACRRSESPVAAQPAQQQSGEKPSQTSADATSALASSSVPVLQVKAYVDPPIPNPGYVGAQACAECHRERLNECLPTSHFNTCRVPEAKKLPRGFEPGQGEFHREGEELRFESFTRGKELVQAAIEPSPGGARRTESSIDLIYGANPISDEVYLSWHADDSMWELPIAWVWADDCWGASGYDRMAKGDHARALTLRCFECHNTWFQHVPGTLSTYRRQDMLLGVTCERCHGPGQEHVTYHKQHPEEKKSHNILYPGSLPRERLIEVCTQCHSNAIKHKGPALSYRPGEELERHYRFVHPAHTEDDHVANQIAYLRQSKCFQHSEMTCITCHDPHHTASAAEGGSFQDSCTQCHKPADCGRQPQLPEPVRGKCVECHMRKYVKINVNFDLANDSYVPPIRRSQHQIAVDPVGEHEVLLDWARASRAALSSNSDAQPGDAPGTEAAQLDQTIEEHKHWLVKHWLEDCRKCEKEYRFMGAIAALREALRIDPESGDAKSELKRMIDTQNRVEALLVEARQLMVQNQDQPAIAKYQELLSLKPNLAQAHSRLGTLAAKAGDYAAARASLEKSIELDPDDQYGVSMLARLAFVQGNFDEAAKLYAQADEIEPYNSKIHLLWGETLLKAGHVPEALEHLRLSDKIDPHQVELLGLLSQLLAGTGEAQAALPYAVRMNELTHYNGLGELKILAEVHIRAGDKLQAASVAKHALQIAHRQQPTAVAGITQWIKENELPQ